MVISRLIAHFDATTFILTRVEVEEMRNVRREGLRVAQ